MSLIGTIVGQKQRVQFIQKDKTVIQIDASVKEDHTRDSPATEFPVEDGTSISDHITVKPFKLTLTGVISDSPLNPLKAGLTTAVASAIKGPLGVIAAGVGTSLFSSIFSSKSPSVAAYEALLNLQQLKQPFDVLTTLKRYPDMWIVNISAPREASGGNSLDFTLQLTQLIIVAPQSVQIQQFSNADLSADEQNAGKQEKTNALVEQFKKGQADAHSLTGL